MLRVILVDDEEPVLDLIERLLGDNGNVKIVGKYIRPEDAITHVRAEPVDVVFLDIHMPGMNGIETAEYLMEADAEIDIVFVTAYSQYATDAFEVSAIDYVLKPPTPDRLNKTIDRLLRRRESVRSGLRAAEGQSNEASEAVQPGFYSFRRFEWIADEQPREPVRWGRSKERELMAYLVHNRNRFVPKEQILEHLWPDALPEKAVIFLHTCVYNIRKKMKHLGCKEQLEYRNNGYRLELLELWCDTAEFKRVADRGMEVDAGNIGEFENVARLYQGDYLEEDGYIWAHEKRERLKSLYIAIMKRMAEVYSSVDKYQAAVNCLLNVLYKNPLLDDVNEMILNVYARMGDRQSMIRHYEKFTSLLKEELRIEPMESTVQLYQRLCSGSAGETPA